MRQVHVIPDRPADQEHTVGTNCWCDPEVETAGEYTVKVTHHPKQEVTDG